MKCTSCGRKVETEQNWVVFPCPGCGKKQILRCEKCKKIGVQYECECGFVGP